MQLHEIREAKASKVNEARTLLASTPTLTAEGQTKFDALKAEIVALEGQEGRAQFVEDMERRTVPTDKPRAAMEARITLLEAVTAQVEQRAAAGALGEYQAEMARTGVTPHHGGLLIPSSLFEQRATMLTTGNPAVTPEDNRPDQMIGLMRNALAVRALGARVLPGLRGDTVIPRQTSAGTAFWVAENGSLTESSPVFDNVTLKPKHVGALSSVSRQLLQQSNPAIEQLLRDDMVAVVGLAIDKAMLHGLTANNEPNGILNTAGIQTAGLAALTWAAIVGMLEKLSLENFSPNAVLTHAKAATKLATTLRDSTSGSEYLLQAGTVAGIPLNVTNQLDAKAGSPAKGRVLVGDFSQLVIGEFQSAELLANPYAAGYYEKGAIQLRIMATMDMVLRNPKAFVLAEDLAIA